MVRIRPLFASLLVIFIVGCSARSVMEHAAPETAQEAKTNFDYLRHEQYSQIEPSLDASIDRTDLASRLQEMAAMIPAGEPISEKTVGAYASCETRKGCFTRVTLEYQFTSKWLLVEMIVHRQNGKSSITSFQVAPESTSLEEANRFTLIDKGAEQYIIFGGALVSILVTLWALVVCIRTPFRRRKWLWILFVLIGIGRVGVNWTTGAIFYRILFIYIPPAMIDNSLYGPWMVAVSLPLGALIFLMMRDKLRRQEPPSVPVDAVSLTGA